MSPEMSDLNTRVQEALDRSPIMALSTTGPNGSWTSPVQYQHDEKLHLYFSSLPDARHVHNLKADPRVSLAIYSFPGPPGGNLGLQIAGRAVELSEGPNDEGWRRFEITPEEAWIFDSRVYGKERRSVALNDLHLEKGPNQ